MGEISEKTKLGIITFIDKRYNYVWNATLGPLELRFPLNPEKEFKLGEVVLYVQSHDGYAPQIVHNLVKYDKSQLNIIRGPKINWKIEVNLVFAARTSKVFRETMENDDENRIKGIAWAQDFLLVASYVEDVDYKEGVVYRAFITRIPYKWEPLAMKVGTIFAIIGKKFEKCTDPVAVEKFWSFCPWKDMFKVQTPSSEESDIGLSSYPQVHNKTNSSNNNGFNDKINCYESKKILYEEKHLSHNFAETLHDLNEGEEKIGLVVICEQEYSVIWNPSDDLVRVQVGPRQKDNDNDPMWPLCEWVKYRCMPEESQIANDVICKYTAYDIKKTKTLKDVTLLKNDTIAVKCNISSAKAHSSEFFIAIDSFFQSVLCSCKDRLLKEQMENDGSSIEVYAVFTDVYKHSRWIAFAQRIKDNWKMITGLPPSVECQVAPFFTHFENRTAIAYETMHNEVLATNKFKAPTDWKGFYYDEEKIVDAIGIVVCFEDEDQTTVIATKFGLARQPKKFPLGVWVLTTIVPDSVSAQLLKNKIRDLGSFIVKRSKKVGPTMSTRVVNHNGVNKLLLCCPVKSNGSKCFVNDYLGKIYDPDNLMRPQQNGSFCDSGYLVELCLSRSLDDGSRYWKILKNHGEYNKTVNCVALKLSYFPTELGLTCDDAHTILVDNIYEADEIVNQKQSTYHQQINNTLKEAVNISSYCETSSAKDPFAHTLPYQIPKVPPMAPQKSSNISENLPSQQKVSPSKSSNSYKPASRIVSNCGTDDCLKLTMQLNCYHPIGETKRQVGIVVLKNENFAILYTRLYGDAIVLPRYFESQQDFDQLLTLGQFIGASFSRVNESTQNDLTYNFMCLPEFKINHKLKIVRRVILGQFVQIYVSCNFTKDKIKECTEEMKESKETERRYFIETEIGNVLLNTEVVDKNDLLGKEVSLWLTHTQKRYGCYWQIALNEMNSLQGDLKIDEIVNVKETENIKQKDEQLINYSISNNNNNSISTLQQHQQQKIDVKSLSGLTRLENSKMYEFSQWEQNQQSSFLPTFGDIPPIPNQQNAILKPEPVLTQFIYGDYNNFLFGNGITAEDGNIGSSSGSPESFNSDHYFSDVSSNLDELIVCSSTPPLNQQINNNNLILEQQNQNNEQNNFLSQSWDDIGLENVFDNVSNNYNDDNNDFIVKNIQQPLKNQSTIIMAAGPYQSIFDMNLDNNNNSSNSVNKIMKKFDYPIGFDDSEETLNIPSSSKKEEEKDIQQNNKNSDDLIFF